MTGSAPQDFEPFQMTVTVSSDGEAQELEEIMERAMMGLKQIIDAIGENPGTMRTRTLVKMCRRNV